LPFLGFRPETPYSTNIVRDNCVSAVLSNFRDVFMHFASAFHSSGNRFLEISDEDVRKMFDVNFHGVWNCYTHAAKQMIKQGPVEEGSSGYKIIGCASIVAFKPFPLLSHYSASKWAVRGLTQVFAMEMAKHKINVNAYAPGIVGTAMWDLIDEKLGEIEGRPKGETVKKYASELTALGRVSVPDDVGRVVGGFMCSKDAEFVTGQTLVIDGGIVFT